MSNQTKGTTTNMTKLVAWDIDQYLSFSEEEDCFIQVSERDKYVLRNVLRQVKWDTRWTSEIGTEQPDRSTIAENLAYKLSQEYCVDICAEIIACIDDPGSGVADAIQNLILESTYEQSREYAQSLNDSVLTDGSNPTCDKDILFGQCLQLVEYGDQTNKDILEIFEIVSNNYEFWVNIIGALTKQSQSFIDAGLEWALWLQENIEENYDAQVTVAYKEELACDLFCVAKDENCELTPRLIYNVLRDRLESTINIDDIFGNAVTFMVTGSWVGTEIADVMYFGQFAVRAMIGRLLENIGWNDIATRLLIYANDPNSDWTLLCDCSDVITVTFDESGYTDYSFIEGTLDNTFGNPLPSGKWEQEAGTLEIVSVEVNMPSPSTVTEISMDAFGSRNRGTIVMVLENSIGTEFTPINSLESFTGWTNFSETGAWSDIVKVTFTNAVTAGLLDELWIDNLKITYGT